MDEQRWQSIRNIFFEEPQATETGSTRKNNNIVGFFTDLLGLDGLDYKVLKEIISNSPVTKKELIRKVSAGDVEIDRSLRDLAQKKLIDSFIKNGVELFFVGSPPSRSGIKNRVFNGPNIPLIQQFDLLCDENRMKSFFEAIDRVVKPGDVVLDLGSGSGILSMLAARKARKVTAVELDPQIAETSRIFMKNSDYGDKITLLNADARDLKLNEKADVVICEMLDTGLIEESQVEVMNYAVENLAKKDFIPIPLKAKSRLQLIQANFSFYGEVISLPYFEDNNTRENYDALSDPVEYDNIDFRSLNNASVDKEVSMHVNKSGNYNAVRITTVIELTEGVNVHGSPWLNPPLIIPVRPGVTEADNTIKARIAFNYGQGVERLKMEVA